MPQSARLSPAQTVFFLCDVQTRFAPAIHGYGELVLTINKILKFAKILEIPVLATEQNPKGLGHTAPEIDLQSLGELHVATIPKTLFSMMTSEVRTFLTDHPHIKSIVLFGIESHVCVLQTALDLLDANYDVWVLADGVSSCNPQEVPIALSHVRQRGGFVTTSESAALQLQRAAGTAQFKEVSRVIKEEKENTRKALAALVPCRSTL